MRCVVFVPQRASAAKVALIEAQGAELRHVGADVDEAKEAARAFAEERDAFFFEDGAEPAQFEGYETIGHELLDAIPGPPGAVVVPSGGMTHSIRTEVVRSVSSLTRRNTRVPVAPAAYSVPEPASNTASIAVVLPAPDAEVWLGNSPTSMRGRCAVRICADQRPPRGLYSGDEAGRCFHAIRH